MHKLFCNASLLGGIILAVFIFSNNTAESSERKLVYHPEKGERAPRSGIKLGDPRMFRVIRKESPEDGYHSTANMDSHSSGSSRLSPVEDGLHDSSLSSVKNELLAPEEGMDGISPDRFGNKVNWVRALEKREVRPVTKITADAPDQEVMDLDMVIPALGYMPNVTFPHKAHTAWLACSNCHKAQTIDQPFFEPVAGKNPMTMVEISAGKWCGFCHSGRYEKVAFPQADCGRCHSGAEKMKPTLLNQSDQQHPASDKLHDPSLFSVREELLPPVDGMTGMTPDEFGNKVDWVRALEKGEIRPVTKVTDDASDQEVYNSEVVIPAVGYMPDVIFPHKAHTIWLSCANCHEAQTFEEPFFEPVAGKNPISMADIMEGKWCGICHSGKTEKVAFPLTNCGRCHTGPLKMTSTPVKPYMLIQ